MNSVFPFPSPMARGLVVLFGSAAVLIVVLLAHLLLRPGDRTPAEVHVAVRPSSNSPTQEGNPFRLKGCIYAAPGQGDSPRSGHCQRGMPLDLKRHFPPGIEPLRRSLALWRQPWNGQVPRQFNGVAAGRDLWLTLKPQQQQLAQQTVECYVGNADKCASAWWYAPRHAADMFESARARSVGVVVLDVRDGAISALAAAHSPCTEARARGKATDAHCPSLPADVARPERLDNPTIEAQMPGSLLKPVQAAALLASEDLSPAEKKSLADVLRRSDTEAMIDLYFCQARDFDQGCITRRVAALDKALVANGFNSNCSSTDGHSCQPRLDLLGGVVGEGSKRVRYDYQAGQLQRRVEDFQLPVFAAQMLRDGQGRSLVGKQGQISAESLRHCYRGGAKTRWRGCQGAALVDLIAEFYGQGNARASALGLAQSWLNLAAAAEGRAQAPRPHLVAAYEDDQGKRYQLAPQKSHQMAPAHAAYLLNSLSQVTFTGSAATACRAAASVGGQLRCQPGSGGMRIASKTGTPLFLPSRRGETDQLAAWRADCAGAQPGCAAARPIKWFAALVAPRGGPWQSLVLVRAERNFHRDGRLDDPQDTGPEGNVAAEIGLALINALATE